MHCANFPRLGHWERDTVDVNLVETCVAAPCRQYRQPDRLAARKVVAFTLVYADRQLSHAEAVPDQ
jgi:hypothetical protein